MLSVIAYSCSNPAKDKRSELDSLKKQRDELNKEISAIEAGLQNSSNEENLRLPLVKILELQPDTFRHYIELQGRVDSDKNITLTSKSAGTVQSVMVNENQYVKKGDILASIDASPIIPQLEAAKTGVEFTKTVFEKQERLWKQNIGSEIQYLEAKNRREMAERQLATLNEQYQMTRFLAPFDGIIDAVFLKEGENIIPGMPAIRIVNQSDYKVVAELAETYAPKINTGYEAEITLPDLNKIITSKLSSSSKVINPLNRTVTIEVKIPSEENLRPNMLAYIRIKNYENKSAFKIPINAILTDHEGSYTYVVEKNIVKKRTLVIGETYKEQAEIKSGLKAGDKVIVIGQQDVVNGQKVKVNQ